MGRNTDHLAPLHSVQERLDDLDVNWDDLSGIAQRALLWDTGFGVTLDNKPVQIWTLAGHSMADLAIPLVQFQDVGCTEQSCPQPDNTTSLSNKFCNGEQMLKAARCVMEDFDDPEEIHLAMWITGGNPSVVPTPTVRKHAWSDDFSNISYVVLAVHTVDIADEPAYGECASDAQNGGYGSLVLACHTKANITDAIRGSLEDVQGTPWVSRWIAEGYSNGGGVSGSGISDSSNSNSIDDGEGFNVLYLIPIIVGGLVMVGLVVLIVFITRRRSKNTDNRSFQDNVGSPSVSYQASASPVPGAINERRSNVHKNTAPSEDNISLGRPTNASSNGTETTGSRRSVD
ncbi:Protein kinase, partial [Phytophthora palmivora]